MSRHALDLAASGERLGLLARATVGDGGWVNLMEPLIVRAGEAFIAVAAVLHRRGIELHGDWEKFVTWFQRKTQTRLNKGERRKVLTD